MTASRPLPTHVRHVKRGTTYAVLGVAHLQTAAPLADDAEIAIYQGDDGKLWARPVGELLDGRFEIALPPICEDVAAQDGAA